tara:strand:+ start:2023 stop:2157 length:135 start_codon:yes stop_codon:yes gene_type:complete
MSYTYLKISNKDIELILEELAISSLEGNKQLIQAIKNIEVLKDP